MSNNSIALILSSVFLTTLLPTSASAEFINQIKEKRGQNLIASMYPLDNPTFQDRINNERFNREQQERINNAFSRGKVCTKSNPPRCWYPNKVKKLRKPTCESTDLKLCIGPNAKIDAKLFEKMLKALHVNFKNNPKQPRIAYCSFFDSGRYHLVFSDSTTDACSLVKNNVVSRYYRNFPKVQHSQIEKTWKEIKQKNNRNFTKGKINTSANIILTGTCDSNNFYVSLDKAEDLKTILPEITRNNLNNCKLKVRNLNF